MCVTCVRMRCHEAAGHQPTTFHSVSLWYSRVKPPLWKHRCPQQRLSCVAWISKEEHFLSTKKTVAMIFPVDCCTWNFLAVGVPLVFQLYDLLFGLWIMMMDPCFIYCNNSWEEVFWVCCKLSKFSSINCWWHAFCSGVNICGSHRELTFDIIKIEWIILETVAAEMPSSWAVTLTLTRWSWKIMSSTFRHISLKMLPLADLNVNRLQLIPYPT